MLQAIFQGEPGPAEQLVGQMGKSCLLRTSVSASQTLPCLHQVDRQASRPSRRRGLLAAVSSGTLSKEHQQ